MQLAEELERMGREGGHDNAEDSLSRLEGELHRCVDAAPDVQRTLAEGTARL